MKLSLTNCSTFLFKQLKSRGNYMLELSSTTRIKVFNGIGNNIPFTSHPDTSIHILQCIYTTLQYCLNKFRVPVSVCHVAIG